MKTFYEDERGVEGWMDQKMLIFTGLEDGLFQNYFTPTINHKSRPGFPERLFCNVNGYENYIVNSVAIPAV